MSGYASCSLAAWTRSLVSLAETCLVWRSFVDAGRAARGEQAEESQVLCTRYRLIVDASELRRELDTNRPCQSDRLTMHPRRDQHALFRDQIHVILDRIR